jgi:hypothetical protein
VASGLLLTQLPWIAKRFVPYKPQLWRLRATERPPVKLANHRQLVEDRSGVRIIDYRLTNTELQTPLL